MKTQTQTTPLVKIDLYQERYMKSFSVVDDYKNMGPGTLFTGDSGYVKDYDELIDRLKEDIEAHFRMEEFEEFEESELSNPGFDYSKIEFFKTENYLETFIKGCEVTWY